MYLVNDGYLLNDNDDVLDSDTGPLSLLLPPIFR